MFFAATAWICCTAAWCADSVRAWEWHEPPIPYYIKENPKKFPTEKRPWSREKHDVERRAAHNGSEIDHLRAIYAARDFPGVPEKGTLIADKRVRINPQIPGWQSTGYYALPGERMTVHFPDSLRVMHDGKAIFKLRIGCHSGHLDSSVKAWWRMPVIDLTRDVDTIRMEVIHDFGGLVYIDVPSCDSLGHGGVRFHRGLSKIPSFEIMLSGGVEAPIFIGGKTNVGAWREMLSQPCAPWGELVADRIIITLPTRQLRQIGNPAETIELLNKGMSALGWLAAWDVVAPEKLRVPMRFVLDRQRVPAAGHPRYPAMGNLNWGQGFTGDRFRNGFPGLWSELGRNHQDAPFRGLGIDDGFANLFSFAAQMKGHGLTLEKSYLSPRHFNDAMQNYFSDSARLGSSETSVVIQTAPLRQLVAEFGLEPFRKLAIRYRESPWPKTSSIDARWGWFAENLSHIVQRDLAPFFRAWRAPVPMRSVYRTAHLRPWMPSPDFPKKYQKTNP